MAGSHERVFWLVCAVAMGMFLAQGLLYPALPLYLTDELGASKGTAGLVASSLSLAALIGRPWTGWFIDGRGRRPMVVAGPLIVAATTAALLVTGSVAATFVLRFLQGFGTAMFYGGAAATVADIAPADRRARYLSRFSLFFYLGFAIGPAISEYLIGSAGFASVWIAVAFAAGAGSVLGFLLLPETRTDAVGDAPIPTGPILLRHRFFHPAASGPGAVYFTVAVSFTAVSTFLAIYARDIGMGSSEGLFAALSVTVMVTRVGVGGLADRFGRVRVAVPAIAAVALGLGVLAAVRSPTGAYLGAILFGAGYAGAFPTLLAMVVDAAPATERGQAMSSFNLFFDLGSPLGGFLVGSLIDRGGFGAGFGASSAMAVAGAVLLASGVLTRPARPVPMRRHAADSCSPPR